MKFLRRFFAMKNLRKIGVILIGRYGKSDFYYRGQINKVFEIYKISKKYKIFAYILYSNKEQFLAEFNNDILYSRNRQILLSEIFLCAGNISDSKTHYTKLMDFNNTNVTYSYHSSSNPNRDAFYGG